MEFGNFSFRRGDREYGVRLGWDEVRLSDGVIDFKVVTFRRNDQGKDDLVVESHVSVEVDEKRGALLKIKIAGEEVVTQPLSELFEEESTVGRVLESLPSVLYGGDPLVGCLIRSGCSATVGQIVTCKNETNQTPWVRQRVIAIGGCLRKNIPNILSKTVLRAGRCIFRAGF